MGLNKGVFKGDRGTVNMPPVGAPQIMVTTDGGNKMHRNVAFPRRKFPFFGGGGRRGHSPHYTAVFL